MQEIKGQVIKAVSSDFIVDSGDTCISCKSPGKFKYSNQTPVVGDYVMINIETQMITKILPRTNGLIRPSVANIDQAFIITSLKEPDFDDNLLDKILVLLEFNHIKPIICLTKKDLLKFKEMHQYDKIIKYYHSIGYKVIFNKEINKIKKLLKNKTTVFIGQTGSGKSTLLNRLDTSLNFKTGEISKALGRGKHTTTHIELVSMCHGKVLDTPGFSSISLDDLSLEDIKNGFIEFNHYHCPYKDCYHLNEKECLIKKDVGKKILETRYKNYKKIVMNK